MPFRVMEQGFCIFNDLAVAARSAAPAAAGVKKILIVGLERTPGGRHRLDFSG